MLKKVIDDLSLYEKLLEKMIKLNMIKLFNFLINVKFNQINLKNMFIYNYIMEHQDWDTVYTKASKHIDKKEKKKKMLKLNNFLK